MKNIIGRRVVALLICFVMMINICYAGSENVKEESQEVTVDVDGHKIKVSKGNGKFFYAEYELNGVKGELKYNILEDSYKLKIFDIKKKNAQEYDLVVNELNNEKLDFQIKDKNNKTIYEKKENYKKLKQSNALLYEIGVIIGEELLRALAAAGLTFVILGSTYVVASKVKTKIRKKKYNYYEAAIINNMVCVGPALTDELAYGWALECTEKNGVMSINQEKALLLIGELGGLSPLKHSSIYVHLHGNGVAPFWYPHFHPEMNPEAHIWYYR